MTERRQGVGEQGKRRGEEADGRGPLALVEPREDDEGERSEPQSPGRGSTSDASALTKGKRADPEVVPQGKRRRFTAKYKLSILEKADACTEPGQLGALLRREGLYSSSLRTWRRQRDQGSLTGLEPKKRGPRPDPDKELRKRIAKLEKENLRLADKLEKAELIIEVQKKVARLLEAKQAEDGDEKK